jgi:ABC-2 type transport system permease protein
MISALGPYAAIFSSRFRQELQYRAAAIAGLSTQVVFGFIILMVLFAFHASGDGATTMDRADLLAYVWLGQALLGLLPWNVEPTAMGSIRSGEVVNDLLKPLSLYRWWLAQAAAWRVVRTALRCLPMIVLAMLLFPWLGLADYAMPTPVSWEAGLWLLPALALGIALSVVLTVLIQAVMLWTVSPDGIQRLVPAVAIVFSGNLMPLPLMPDWLQPVLNWQPLRGVVDVPAQIYSGHLVGSERLLALANSLLWLLLLMPLGAWLVQRGLRRLEVAGG